MPNTFHNRDAEISRLERALNAESPGLCVVYGRRRCGKSTLLQRILRPGDLYVQADQSEAALQIRDMAIRAGQLIPGFDAVTYPTWDALLSTLHERVDRRMAVIIDEFPYWVQSAPELPSTLQRLLDRPGPKRIDWMLCGSSQRMMHSAVLDASAPLYGRAREVLKIRPLSPGWILNALGGPAEQAVRHFAVWGGIPRYWELAAECKDWDDAVAQLLLDRHGVLHEEPQRLLQEEMRTTVQARSLLALIGSGCHRLSEIAARIQRPAASLTRPLNLLIDLGLVRRELPWGESTRSTKRTLYRIADPLMRFYFRYVIPNLSLLELGKTQFVMQQVKETLPGFFGETWEDLARDSVPFLKLGGVDWGAAARWWGKDRSGKPTEVDIIAESLDGKHLLIGEAKWTLNPDDVPQMLQRLKSLPERLPMTSNRNIVHAIWCRAPLTVLKDIHIITPDILMPVLKT